MAKDPSEKRIYGLIGYPVKHSLSPIMHNAAFENLKEQGKIDYDAEYRLFEVPPKRLEEFLLDPNAKFDDIDGNSIRAGAVLGFNITIPHKVKADQILEREFPFDRNAYMMNEDLYYVKLSGAVNTVKREGNKYYNTDARGFLDSLKANWGFETKDKNVLLIGCGGAGRAIIAVLSWKKAQIKKIYIYDISKEAMKSAEEHFRPFDFVKDKLEYVQEKEIIPGMIKKCQLLVNASPVGMKEGDGSVIDKSLLHENLSVYDVVYSRQTQLIKDAESLPGRPVKNGLGMLLYQGVDAFELWTEQKAPVEVMRKALREATSK
jgi:shikimate dehydrogenase